MGKSYIFHLLLKLRPEKSERHDVDTLCLHSSRDNVCLKKLMLLKHIEEIPFLSLKRVKFRGRPCGVAVGFVCSASAAQRSIYPCWFCISLNLSLCVLINKFNLLTFIEIIDIYYYYYCAFKFSLHHPGLFFHCFTSSLFLPWFK